MVPYFTSDDYLRATLREGRPGRVMPAFPGLSGDQVSAIIGHIRSWSDTDGPTYPAETLNGQLARGKMLFAGHCAACHGDKGQRGVARG
jgi:cytochrome c oxidase cbb3-type subunit 3